MRARLVAFVVLLVLPIASATPEQVHLGLRDADALAGYTVSWVETDPAAVPTLTFHGPDGDVDIQGRLVTGPTPGLVYEATLPALAPGGNATYEIGGRVFELRILANDSLTLFALGDMGVTRQAGAAVKVIEADAPGLVLHLGDVSYAGGDALTWKAWFDLVEPVASRAPWIPALGNHEGDVAGISADAASVPDPTEQAVMKQRFPIPRETFWYSFDLGGAHFISLDTFSEVQIPAQERAWLEADLTAAQGARWIVAYLHESPYSSNAYHGSSPRAYGAFAELLERNGVDLVLSAHDHSYERTFALRSGEVVTRANETTKGTGTVYVVTGGGGAALYETFLDPQPEWSAEREPLHHVLRLRITPDRIEGETVATDGSPFRDTFAIVRPMDDPAQPSAPTPAAPLFAVALAILAAARMRRR